MNLSPYRHRPLACEPVTESSRTFTSLKLGSLRLMHNPFELPQARDYFPPP